LRFAFRDAWPRGTPVRSPRPPSCQSKSEVSRFPGRPRARHCAASGSSSTVRTAAASPATSRGGHDTPGLPVDHRLAQAADVSTSPAGVPAAAGPPGRPARTARNGWAVPRRRPAAAPPAVRRGPGVRRNRVALSTLCLRGLLDEPVLPGYPLRRWSAWYRGACGRIRRSAAMDVVQHPSRTPAAPRRAARAGPVRGRLRRKTASAPASIAVADHRDLGQTPDRTTR